MNKARDLYLLPHLRVCVSVCLSCMLVFLVQTETSACAKPVKIQAHS